jgi:hypothetical protein
MVCKLTRLSSATKLILKKEPAGTYGLNLPGARRLQAVIEPHTHIM